MSGLEGKLAQLVEQLLVQRSVGLLPGSIRVSQNCVPILHGMLQMIVALRHSSARNEQERRVQQLQQSVDDKLEEMQTRLRKVQQGMLIAT